MRALKCVCLGRKLWGLRLDRGLVAALVLVAGTPVGAQNRNCSIEPLGERFPLRVEAVNENLGDWRVSCTGFGPGPVTLNVFFDGPITNPTATVYGREVTLVMAILEGTTPDNAVFQIPGQGFVPLLAYEGDRRNGPGQGGANVFVFEMALVHESELARNEPDSQVHHLPRAYDDGLPSSAIRLRM